VWGANTFDDPKCGEVCHALFTPEIDAPDSCWFGWLARPRDGRSAARDCNRRPGDEEQGHQDADGATHAVGRSGSPGHLAQYRHAGHAVRAAGGTGGTGRPKRR
jgi:hypothetical protein